MKKKSVFGSLLMAVTFVCAGKAVAAFRPPAVPIAPVDPFFSVWSPADRLAERPTMHWTSAVQPMEATLEMDGKRFRLMGMNPQEAPALPQTGCEITPLQTVCTFANAEVAAKLVFSTPMLTDDLDVFSRPVTYVTFSASALDGKAHSFRFSYKVGGQIAVNDNAAEVDASFEKMSGLAAASVGQTKQRVLGRSGDSIRIDWGRFWIAAPEGNAEAFVEPASGKAAAQAAAVGVNASGKGAVLQTHLILAYDEVYPIMFFGKKLDTWCQRGGKSFRAMLAEAANDYAGLMKRMDAFDTAFTADLRKIGDEKYAQMACLAYRQSFGACKLVAGPDGNPLYFSKENASCGAIGTVDVFYPQFPHLLLMSPVLARASLAPILLYAESDHWTLPFPPHCVGTYPLANGQDNFYKAGQTPEQANVNHMPVELCGDMLICLASLAEAEGNADFAFRWWPLVTRWAEYLAEKGFDPENQLCTDDFTGHLAHNANLSVKTIVSLACYAKLAEKKGDAAAARKYRALAETAVPKWVAAAQGGANGAYRLAFDKPGTWSMKYNLVWDRLLGLNLFPANIAETEMAAYRKCMQPFGLPLDNRSMYAKADWIVWTACLTGKRGDFEAVIDPLYRFVTETPSRNPWSDWYDAKTGKMIGFLARSVIGGVFLPMLYDPECRVKYARRAEAGKGVYAPVDTSAKKTYTVTRVKDGSVQVDGVLAEDAWKQAKMEADFVSPWDDGLKPGTLFRAVMDNSALYFAFEVQDSTPLVFEKTEKETDVASEDRVEIFFACDGALKKYYVAEMDPAGRVLDYPASFFRIFDYPWSFPAGSFKTAGRKTATGYILEGCATREAFKAMGLEAFFEGKPVRAGLYRAEFSKTPDGKIDQKWISWVTPDSPTPEFHIPSSFGSLQPK